MAKNRNGNLERAVRKIKRHSAHEFCGYLTPSEIVAITENGGMVDKTSESWVNYAKNKLESGVSNPTWFYFTIRPNSTLANKLGGEITDTSHDKRG